jgi:rhodanese-related sulfurtransferase
MEIARISLAEVKKRLDAGEPVFFIDTRNMHDWGASDVMIPGARRIHYSELVPHLAEIPRDRLIVTYCT